MQQYRVKLLNAHAEEAECRRRAAGRDLAAEWGAAAAAAAARTAQERAEYRSKVMDISHVAPVERRPEESRAALRAQAIDFREDLDVQVARKKVRFSWGRACWAPARDFQGTRSRKMVSWCQGRAPVPLYVDLDSS